MEVKHFTYPGSQTVNLLVKIDKKIEFLETTVQPSILKGGKADRSNLKPFCFQACYKKVSDPGPKHATQLEPSDQDVVIYLIRYRRRRQRDASETAIARDWEPKHK